MSAELAFVAALDCSKFSDERGDPKCEERLQVSMGVVVVAVAVLLVVSFVAWRFLKWKFANRSAES